MTKKVFVIFIVFLICAASSLQAQDSGTVRGTVQMDDGTALPGVTIQILGLSISTQTDSNGQYVLEGISQGKILLSATLAGFKEQKETIYIQNGKMTVRNFTLRLLKISEETLVTAQRPLLSASEKVSKITLAPSQIATLPSLGEKDIFRAFQLLPGISGSNETSSGLYVRGGKPDQNLILYDGFTIYHADHLFGYFSTFNMEAIKEVSLYKGGFEAKYGGRLSSVMELTGKSGDQDKLTVGAGVSLLSVNGILEIPFSDKLSFVFAGRRSFQSPLYDKIANLFDNNQGGPQAQARPGGGGRGGGAQFDFQPSSYFYDINSRLTFQPSDKDLLFLSFYKGKDNLDNSREQSAPSRFQDMGIDFQMNIADLTEWGNTGVSLHWGRDWGKVYSSALTLSYSNYFNNRERNVEMDITVSPDAEMPDFFKFRSRRGNGTIEDNDLKDKTLNFRNIFTLSKNNTLEMGFQVKNNDVNYRFDRQESEEGDSDDSNEVPPLPFFSILNRSDAGYTYAAYVQDQWTLFNRLTIIPGFRATYFDVTQKTYYEPRFSFNLNLTDRLRFKGAWGKYYQYVNRITREDSMQGNREFWALSDNIKIPVASAIHYIAGISYETDMFLFDIEAYYKDLSGLTEFAPRFTPLSGEIDWNEFFYQGTGTARGIEFLLQKKFGAYTGWISYTLGKVEYNFPGLSEKPFPALHDQTHEFKMVNSFELNNWTFAGTYIYATGKPYTPAVGIEQAVFPSGRIFDQVVLGEKNSERLPAYHRMDLSATYQFKLGDADAALGATLFNVYNRQNTWYKEYDVIEGEIIENNINLMGMTFNIFLNIKF